MQAAVRKPVVIVQSEIRLSRDSEVRVVSDQQRVKIIENDGTETLCAPKELVMVTCADCSQTAYLIFNVGRCAYCSGTNVKAAWIEPRMALVPIP